MFWLGRKRKGDRKAPENLPAVLHGVGMYEEPRPIVDIGELPAPLKELSHGDTFYRANGTGTISKEKFDSEYEFHLQVLNNGFCFKTEADAQAWLNATKEARR